MTSEAGVSEKIAVATRRALDGLRVLFLPKNSRTDYFAALLRKARQTHNWTVHIPCSDEADAIWKPVIGSGGATVRIPDFTLAAPADNEEPSIGDIDGFIAACEAAAGVSAGRIILAGERELGRGFSRPTYHWFHTNMVRTVLADNTEPFRILRRMFAFARETLQTSKPDLLLAGEWADPLCFTFYLAARKMGIRCAVNRPSKIWSGRSYWSAEPMMYNHAVRTLVAQKKAEGAPVSPEAHERIAAFRSAPSTLGYVQQSWEANDRRGFLAYHVDLARLCWVEIRHYLLRRSGPPPKPALQLALEHYRRAWLKRWQARFFKRFDESALRDMRYIFIALHKDPEQALNYQAPFWVNQFNTVALLVGSLPTGYRLLVREHRNNAGRRPTRYYKEMSRLPGVDLVDAFDRQFKYIANANLIVTDNGSTGWEGLLLGRPVITLADTFYDSAELAHRVRDPEQLATDVLAAIEHAPAGNGSTHDQALGQLLDAEWETTVAFDAADHGRTLALLADAYTGKDSSPPTAANLPT